MAGKRQKKTVLKKDPDPTVGIVWFRQDLRLADNPALMEAVAECDAIVPLFIDDPRPETVSRLGAASQVWLHHSLQALKSDLQDFQSDLVVVQGESLPVLRALAVAVGAERIYWNRCYDPATVERDTRIKSALKDYQPASSTGILLLEPKHARKADDTPYRVYTPFWRSLAARLPLRKPLKAPAGLPPLPTSTPLPGDALTGKASCTDIEGLGLLPSRDWHIDMMSHWHVGEAAAQKALARFRKKHIHAYDELRNVPGQSGTSQLSAHLHFGEISPTQVLHTVLGRRTLNDLGEGEETFIKEIVWREFGYSMLLHFPDTLNEPLDKRFNRFPWRDDYQDDLNAWQQGRTGVPIVDAGMRELYATGWMHNRVRMVVASYLIKNLLIPWQCGERWFRDTLVDADLASNALGWQWAAGSGADAAPFFRIFNPVLQGEKFDKAGDYVRHWVPELGDVAQKFVHKPWELPAAEFAKLDYPRPLVDLKMSRGRALDAFAAIK